MDHGLGPTRARVLQLLQSSGDPLSVSEIAEQLDLHRNSARFHLDALEEQGFARRTVAVTGQQGRPPLMYLATNESPSISNEHMFELVNVLMKSFVAPAENGAARAHAVGREWGRSTAQDAETRGAALLELESYFGERGFAASHTHDTFTMTRCPFRTAVDAETLPLVCAMHCGFVDGYLEQRGSEQEVAGLEVGRETCSMQISEAPAV